MKAVLSVTLALCGAIIPFPTLCQTDISRSVAKWSQAVVAIEARSADNRATSVGSGFIVSADGRIATNLHVILGFDSIRVELPSGASYSDVVVIAYDEQKDLALLKVPSAGLPRLELGEFSQVRAGLPVVALGSPRGLRGTITQGIVSALREHPAGGFSVIQTDAAINPGNSGGPLLNRKGQVIGVVVAKLTNSEGLNFAIPVSYLRPLLDSAVGSLSIADVNRRLKASAPRREVDVARMPTRWKNLETGAVWILRTITDMFHLERVFADVDQSFGPYEHYEIRSDGKTVTTLRKIGIVGFFNDGSAKLCKFEIQNDLEIVEFLPDRIEAQATEYSVRITPNQVECERLSSRKVGIRLIPALPEDQPRPVLLSERRKALAEGDAERRQSYAQRCQELMDLYGKFCLRQPASVCPLVRDDIAFYCRR